MTAPTDHRLYARVAAAVRRLIDAGTLQPGDTVPVRSLVLRYGVAPRTVASGLRLLAAEGRLKFRHGHGYTVLTPAGRQAGGW